MGDKLIRSCVALICAAAVCGMSSGGAGAVSSSARQAGPGTPACTAPGGHTPDLQVADPSAPHGLYVLSGAQPLSQSPLGPSIQQYLVNNPDVCGGSVFVNWSQVDNGPNANPRYNWSRVDALIAPWAQAHKTVSIQLGGSGYSGNVLAGIPGWLLPQLQTVTCGNDTAPVYWQSTYETNWQSFVSAFVQHYQSNANVAYIHVGVGTGAQTLVVGVKNAPACLARWNDAGYQTQWPTYVLQMISFVASLHAPVQVNVSFNDYANFPTADQIAAADAAAGIGFGFSGLQASDSAAYTARQPCGQTGANWCALYDQYAGTTPLFVQTLQASYRGPPVSGATPQTQYGMQQTGPLQPLLTTALAVHAQIFELYAQDWLLAFDPSYPGYAQYHAAYAQALDSAAEIVGTAGGAANGVTSSTPKLSAVRLTPSSFEAGHGSTLTLRLSAPARITVAIERSTTGRKPKGHCEAHAKTGKPCTLTTQKAKLTFTGVTGPNDFKLRIASLSAGSYSAAVTAGNTAGKSSTPVTLAFRIS